MLNIAHFQRISHLSIPSAMQHLFCEKWSKLNISERRRCKSLLQSVVPARGDVSDGNRIANQKKL